MNLRFATTLVTLLSVGIGTAQADEGMWTFNHFPKKLVKQRYRFNVTDEWLTHVQQASVRFNSGGSGSFVSSQGLVMTNHHVGADCINKLGATDHDYIRDGYFATSSKDEIKCPDLELNVLVEITDVTDAVKKSGQELKDEAAANRAQKGKMAEIEKSCADKTHDRCDVITLYQGGLYNLYRYHRYTDIRLVFAPEFQIAFFGGDPDNFEFPRYDLDVAFFRAYEADKPVKPAHYLAWSKNGAKENELVFTSGHPGNTERLDTVAQLEFLRDVSYPALLQEFERLQKILQTFSARGSEEARQARTPLFGVENAIKAFRGYHRGLLDKNLMEKKRAAEEAFRKLVGADPAKQEKFGNVWPAIASAYKGFEGYYKRWLFLEGRRGNPFASDLFGYARLLVRAAEEKAKPNEKRLREYRESSLESLELALFSTAPVHDALEQVQVAGAIARLQKEWGDKDPLVKTLLAGKTPDERAKEIVERTRLKEIAFRKQLYSNKSALDASRDPMILLAKAVDPEARGARKRYEDEVESVVKKNLGYIGQAQFQTAGLNTYPDATFTLRLSYGKVAGYEQDGKKIPPTTNIQGLYERSKRAEGKFPWDLPKRWLEATGKVNGKTAMDVVSTNDIIGGNSGSPLINAKGEVVGLIFDGNMQSLPGNFVYDDRQNRAISVHSAAIIEALEKVYGAGSLAQELRAKP